MKCVIRYFGQTAGTAVDAVINAGKLLAAGYFVTLLNAEIAGITVNDLIVFPD